MPREELQVHVAKDNGILRDVQIPGCQRCDFMHFGGQSVTENELFMIIKLDVQVALFHL